jgi:hypothetical protein
MNRPIFVSVDYYHDFESGNIVSEIQVQEAVMRVGAGELVSVVENASIIESEKGYSGMHGLYTDASGSRSFAETDIHHYAIRNADSVSSHDSDASDEGSGRNREGQMSTFRECESESDLLFVELYRSQICETVRRFMSRLGDAFPNATRICDSGHV